MKTQRFSTTVKHIGNQRFEIAILADRDEMYCVAYQTFDKISYSEQITDYNMATFLFDMKYNELEGQ